MPAKINPGLVTTKCATQLAEVAAKQHAQRLYSLLWAQLLTNHNQLHHVLLTFSQKVVGWALDFPSRVQSLHPVCDKDQNFAEFTQLHYVTYTSGMTSSNQPATFWQP